MRQNKLFTCKFPTFLFLDILHIRPDVLERGLTATHLGHVNLTNEVKAGENVGNVIETSDLGWKQTRTSIYFGARENFITAWKLMRHSVKAAINDYS